MENVNTRAPAETSRGWQFSIRGLLLLTAAVALLLALPTELAFALPWFVTALVIPVSVVVIVWGHSADRAFAIGTLFGILSWAFYGQGTGMMLGAERLPVFYWTMAWGWITGAGIVCQRARRWAVARKRRLEPHDAA